jgi:hypothetical protein
MIDEVGTLHDERRRLQQCVPPARVCGRGGLSARRTISEPMTLKPNLGAGGE